MSETYGTPPEAEPDEWVEHGDVEDVGTCTVDATAEVTVTVTVSVLQQGDPADDFSRLSDYAADLYEPSAVNDDRESTEDLDGGWWSRGTAWRTSWPEAGDASQLVDAATAISDNLQVNVVVVERDLGADSLTTAEARVGELVVAQLEAALRADGSGGPFRQRDALNRFPVGV